MKNREDSDVNKFNLEQSDKVCRMNDNLASIKVSSGIYSQATLIVFFLFCFLINLFFSLNAATITSTGTGGNWNAGGTWAGGSAPAATDSVVIASGATVATNGSRSCKSLTIIGTLTMANSNTLTLTGNFTNNGTISMNGNSANPNTLTLAGNFINNGTFNAGFSTVVFNGNNLLQTVSGSVTTAFNLITVNKGTSVNNILNVTSVISMASDGLTVTNGTFKLSSASTITPFTGATSLGSNSGLWNNGGTISATGGALTLTGLFRNTTGTTTIGSGIDENLVYLTGSNIIVEGGSVNIAGALIPNTPGTDMTTYTQSGGTFTCGISGVLTSFSTGLFDIRAAGSSFTMSGGTIVIVRDNLFYAGADVQLLATTSSVTGGTIQIGNASTPASRTILINSTVPFFNLTINSTNSPTARLLTNSLTVKNNLSIASGATLNLNNLNLTIGGNWSRIGTFTPGTGTVTFNLGNSQSITGATTFYALTINKTSKAITLNNDMTITNSLTFVSGIMKGLSNLLIINDNVTVTGASNASHFKGSVRKVGNDAFTFPVGDSTFYAPISISAPTSVTQEFTGTYFHSAYSNTDSIIGMNNVSTEEYWTLDRAVNTDSVNVTLSFSSDRGSYANPSNLSDLKVARWNGSKWVSHGNGGTSFSSPDGTIVTSYKVTGFSPFTLGSSMGLSPLPIDWIDFKAKEVSENQVDLSWTMAETSKSEFSIKKSFDAKNWSEIGKVGSNSAASNAEPYYFSDMYAVKGIQYYQIERLGYNGSQRFSIIIPVSVKRSLNSEVVMGPNPVSDYLNLHIQTEESSVVQLFSMTGEKLLEQEVASGHSIILDLAVLETGVYWIEVLSNGKLVKREKLLKN